MDVRCEIRDRRLGRVFPRGGAGERGGDRGADHECENGEEPSHDEITPTVNTVAKAASIPSATISAIAHTASARDVV